MPTLLLAIVIGLDEAHAGNDDTYEDRQRYPLDRHRQASERVASILLAVLAGARQADGFGCPFMPSTNLVPNAMDQSYPYPSSQIPSALLGHRHDDFGSILSQRGT